MSNIIKIWFILLAIAILSVSAKAQSVDDRIADAMNTSDDFGLYDTYHNATKDSINPFLEVFSRCLIGNRLNQPNISIPAFEELFKTQSKNLDLNLLLQSAVMYSMDLSRVGRNAEANDVLASALSSAYQVVDSTRLTPYADMAARYKALTKYSPSLLSTKNGRG